MRHLQEILSGMTDLFRWWDVRSYVEPQGFAADREKLAGDLRVVGGDMRKVVNRAEVNGEKHICTS